MPKKMPGFQDYQSDLEKKRQIAKEKKETEQRIAKEKEDAKIKQRETQKKLKEAQKQLNKKLKIITENYKEDGKPVLVTNSSASVFLRSFFFFNVLSFVIGSAVFLANDGTSADDYSFGHEPLFTPYDIYGDMSYTQAIKNAYLLDDWRHGKGGSFQGVCGLLSIFIALSLALYLTDGLKSENRKKIKAAKELLADLEHLKDYNVDIPYMVGELKPSCIKILKSLSEIDRGYFDNLINGGLDKANYETCVAIVSGYLKSHPKEYNKIIEVIDEATLPEAIKKKYGKGKTISFAAAKAMQAEK